MLICIALFLWKGTQRQRIKEHYTTDDEGISRILLHMIGVISILEAIQSLYLTQYLGFITMAQPSSWMGFVREYALFVPKSFLFELIFDFCHYWAHRAGHKIKCLYRYVHMDHHNHSHPGPWTTFDQSAMDCLVSNMAPLLAAVALGIIFPPMKLTIWQYHLLLAYKTFAEVAGHSALDTHAASFPQFPGVFWQVRLFTDMCLTSHDHYEHHRIYVGNYSKRFRVWDVLFGTYRQTNKRIFITERDVMKSACFMTAVSLLTTSLGHY